MFTYDHSTLRLFGVPLFSLVVGLVFVVSVLAFIFGVLRWRHPHGKAMAVAAGLVLLLFALAFACVLITVESGSMG